MSIDINNLKIFLTISETGSFTKAGKKLSKAQSSISTAISNLEIDLGVTLFDRSGKTPVLTDIGKSLLKDAKNIIKQTEEMENKAYYFSNDNEGKIRLVTDFNLVSPNFFGILEKFDEKFPKTELEILDSNLIDTIYYIENNIADIGIYATRLIGIGDKIKKTNIGRLKILPICSKNHELANKKNVSFNELKSHKQVAIIGKYAILEEKDYTISNNIWLVENGNLVRKLIRSGIGWGLMPEFYVRDHLKNGDIKTIDCDYYQEDIEVLVYAVWNKNYKAGKVANWVIKEFKKMYEN